MSEVARQRSLGAYQASLPVRLIATDRENFVTCSPNERMDDVLRRNEADQFDHLPVRDEGSGAILGVLPVWGVSIDSASKLVDDCFQRLHENLLIGAGVGILDFARQAHERPFRFIVDGQHISGLVSLSDLQQLPVRAALFAMVTQLEMSMAEVISTAFPNGSWRQHLTEGRQQKLDEELDRARKDANQVDPILYTQFCDKAGLLKRLPGPFSHDLASGEIERKRKELERLRNRLAHGNDIAATREEARQVCGLVHVMDEWLGRLEDSVRNIPLATVSQPV